MLKLIARSSQATKFFVISVTTLIVFASDPMAGWPNSSMTRLFVPVDIEVNISSLPDSERQALSHIVTGARVMDSIFLQ